MPTAWTYDKDMHEEHVAIRTKGRNGTSRRRRHHASASSLLVVLPAMERSSAIVVCSHRGRVFSLTRDAQRSDHQTIANCETAE
jgi:hypothetical protein